MCVHVNVCVIVIVYMYDRMSVSMGQSERECVSACVTVSAGVCTLALGCSGRSLELPPPWKEAAGRGQMVSSDPLFIIQAKAYSV